MASVRPPTLYFGLKVGLFAQAGAGADGGGARLALSAGNPGPAPWAGRIPVVWVQGGVTWSEGVDVDLAPGQRATYPLARRWAPGDAPLEARLATERPPRTLFAMDPVQFEAYAVASRYISLGGLGIAAEPPPPTPAQERSARLRDSIWLVIAAVTAVVAAVLLVIYATSIL
ncbi:MAG TPA: hypothetical protein VMG99_05005 [Thermoplasmata archaeon]|nr:hypothetical protein [Thermoplasmata archaeon]